MSKLSDALREQKIFNNWYMLIQFGGDMDVAVEYHRPAEGRLGWCDSSRTRVWSPRKNPKLGGPTGLSREWVKNFLGIRKESLPAALAWASEEFREIYVVSPFGGYLPKHIILKAKKSIKVQKDLAP